MCCCFGLFLCLRNLMKSFKTVSYAKKAMAIYKDPRTKQVMQLAKTKLKRQRDKVMKRKSRRRRSKENRGGNVDVETGTSEEQQQYGRELKGENNSRGSSWKDVRIIQNENLRDGMRHSGKRGQSRGRKDGNHLDQRYAHSSTDNTDTVTTSSDGDESYDKGATYNNRNVGKNNGNSSNNRKHGCINKNIHIPEIKTHKECREKYCKQCRYAGNYYRPNLSECIYGNKNYNRNNKANRHNNYRTIKDSRNNNYITIKDSRNNNYRTIKDSRNNNYSTIKDSRNNNYRIIKDSRNNNYNRNNKASRTINNQNIEDSRNNINKIDKETRNIKDSRTYEDKRISRKQTLSNMKSIF